MQVAEKKKITHTQRKKEEFERDQRFFLKKANITEDEYYNFVFENGCLFAEQEMKSLFPNWKGERMNSIINRVTFNKWYWDWWKTEWKTILNQIVVNTMGDPRYFGDRLNSNTFRMVFNYHMTAIINDSRFSRSFTHLLERKKW